MRCMLHTQTRNISEGTFSVIIKKGVECGWKYEFNEMVWWRFDYKEINKNIVLKLAQFPLSFSILVAFFQGSNFFGVIEASSVKHFAEEKKIVFRRESSTENCNNQKRVCYNFFAWRMINSQITSLKLHKIAEKIINFHICWARSVDNVIKCLMHVLHTPAFHQRYPEECCFQLHLNDKKMSWLECC